jgi:hypothetical protein
MKSGSLVRAALAMGFVLPLCAAALPGAALACGGEVYREMDSTTQIVAQAEQALSEGKLGKAAIKAIQAYPALKIVKPGQVPLADRALRIMALAAVRADGGITAGGFKGKEGAANLEWSVDTLRSLTAKRANNPSYQTDLGEALSKIPAHHEEAAKMLGELAAKDLLTSPEGYAALARLRAESGDATARDEAVKRCEAMTKTPRICEVPAAAPPAAAPPAAVAVAAVPGQT